MSLFLMNLSAPVREGGTRHQCSERKDVMTRITDCGPRVNGRTLDLSYAAAKALGTAI